MLEATVGGLGHGGVPGLEVGAGGRQFRDGHTRHLTQSGAQIRAIRGGRNGTKRVFGRYPQGLADLTKLGRAARRSGHGAPSGDWLENCRTRRDGRAEVAPHPRPLSPEGRGGMIKRPLARPSGPAHDTPAGPTWDRGTPDHPTGRGIGKMDGSRAVQAGSRAVQARSRVYREPVSGADRVRVSGRAWRFRPTWPTWPTLSASSGRRHSSPDQLRRRFSLAR